MPRKPVGDRYVSIKSLVFDSPAFRTLPSAALKLWVDLRTQFRGGNNGNISAALSTLRHRGWRSSDTLNNALRELLTRGLLRRTREGKAGPLRLCSLFAFTDHATNPNDSLGITGAGPSMEFAKWSPGMSFAPESKAKKIARNSRNDKTLVRKSNRHQFDCQGDTDSETEQWERRTDTKIDSVITGTNGSEPAPVLPFDPIVH